MRTKGKGRLAQLGEQVLSDVPARDKPAAPQPNRVDRREAAARVGATPAVRGAGGTVRALPTERLRLWGDHNRDYEALTEARCRDLIDSFRSEGQQFPAIGRPVADDPSVDVELVVGARRLWTARYLDRPLLVEIRALDDRGAFALMDLENRNRQDISDLERAHDYRRALPKYYEGNATRMAQSLAMDRGNLSRLLALTELPEEIIAAYGDPRELVVHHGTVYAKLLKASGSRRRMVAEAKRLTGKGLDGKHVVRALRSAATEVAPRIAPPRQQGAVTWKPLAKGRGYGVSFELRAGADVDALHALRRDIDTVLDLLVTGHPDAETDT